MIEGEGFRGSTERAASSPGSRHDPRELREGRKKAWVGKASEFSAVLRPQPRQWGVLVHRLPIRRDLNEAGVARANIKCPCSAQSLAGGVLGEAWLWQ